MSQVIRYVHISNGKVCIEEHFLGFILSHEKTGKGLASEILTQLSDDDLNIQNCRGQAYDNGANMAGKYKGVQAKIMEKNSLATFIPCTAHSLNLAGVNAVSSNVQMKNFFGKIQQLFNFFSGSPSRWEELKSLKLTLKPFSDTRWSSKSVAIKAVFTQLPEVRNALNNIIEIGNAESIFLAKSLLLFIDYEFICLLSIWNAILSSIDRVNVCLHSKSLTINKAANLIKGLINEITDLRNNRLETLFQSAEELSKKMGIATVFPQKRIKRVKLLDLEESTDDWNATSKKTCIINFKNLNQVSSDFGFLNGADLVERDSNYLIKAAADLAIKYDNDLKPSDFTSEIINFKNLALGMLPDLKNQTPLNILELIHEYSMTDIFPNICIAIRLYLTLPCTTASCERSFSKLKLIKTYLRSTMNQNRLTNLSLLSIEKEITKTVDFDSVIDNFSAIKARKIKF
ncbi:zinc finger MYM-type protein 1-like [Metopolophium dirhodum]|uniref:zinc finger MYM-type protein 1-like n=1 Tax=Metopolophium dirhodum TaxID=44670 RepID=UPI00298FD5A5|nr:zinc finger MYM-type protein 1-like [Metopolophium dirhodum]